MRAALVGTALATGLVLGGPALMITPAHASTQQSNPDVDEPLEQDGEQDTGKYGLIGLTGMVGLFGYKKYRDRAHHRGTPVGGVDTDGSGSRRI